MTDVAAALAARGEAKVRDGLDRYGIATADRGIGVPMAARWIGRDAQRVFTKAQKAECRPVGAKQALERLAT